MPGLMNGGQNVYQDTIPGQNTSGSNEFTNSYSPLQLTSPVTDMTTSPNYIYTNSKPVTLPTSFQFPAHEVSLYRYTPILILHTKTSLLFTKMDSRKVIFRFQGSTFLPQIFEFISPTNLSV